MKPKTIYLLLCIAGTAIPCVFSRLMYGLKPEKERP
jgi:hypothetical protein